LRSLKERNETVFSRKREVEAHEEKRGCRGVLKQNNDFLKHPAINRGAQEFASAAAAAAAAPQDETRLGGLTRD
jgi:hypothetical protein